MVRAALRPHRTPAACRSPHRSRLRQFLPLCHCAFVAAPTRIGAMQTSQLRRRHSCYSGLEWFRRSEWRDTLTHLSIACLILWGNDSYHFGSSADARGNEAGCGSHLFDDRKVNRHREKGCGSVSLPRYAAPRFSTPTYDFLRRMLPLGAGRRELRWPPTVQVWFTS
jgi:hypothetical protein